MSNRRKFLFGTAILAIGGTGLVTAGGTNLFYTTMTEYVGGDALSVENAHALAISGEITLIDIRRPDEWASTGTGEGAVRLDMRRDDFADALSSLVRADRDASIVLICARGVRSARVSNQLVEAGFTNIIDVPEGMLGSTAGSGWLQKGLPLVIDH